MNVNKVPLDGIDMTQSHMKYCVYWLGISKYDLFEVPTSPLTQFFYPNRPPRLTNRTKILNELRLIIKSINDIDQDSRFGDEDLDSSHLLSTSQSKATIALVQNLSLCL